MQKQNILVFHDAFVKKKKKKKEQTKNYQQTSVFSKIASAQLLPTPCSTKNTHEK
jgi:hypothetical protein